jgi:hypothetical protein
MDVIINSDLVLFMGFASRAVATAKAGRSARREYEPRAPCRASAVRYKLHGAVRSKGGGEARAEISSSFQRGSRTIDYSCKLVKLAVLS